jgi:predicted protein tyrosine phosphatase
MAKMNRLANTKNEFQGKFKRVLVVCTAGLLRSPTAAEVLSREPFNFNTRAVGISREFALVIIDDVLLHWADEIVCMSIDHKLEVKKMLGDRDIPIITLDISDDYKFRDPELIKLIADRYTEILNIAKKSIIKKDG